MRGAGRMYGGCSDTYGNFAAVSPVALPNYR
jgi:hypothetical protein